MNDLERDGFVELSFGDVDPLFEIQKLLTDAFPCVPEEWHAMEKSQGEHVAFVKHISDQLAQKRLVEELVRKNADLLSPILGPDIDIQREAHLRVSRPVRESDLVDWHRDTFYGNSPWEMNLWFPVFPLREGAGLVLIQGSHVQPSRNVRDAIDADPFRKSVTKLSTANQIGYVYAPKTDDTISAMGSSGIRLLAPQVGKAILFFGCAAHRAQNRSDSTRISIDVRLRNSHTSTNTRSGYYVELCRGVISRCAKKFSGDLLDPQ